jgi:phytoene dehydrogenase-like protein
MRRPADAVVIGSGLNGLVAAAYLARGGWDVEVVERNPVAGGAIATEELTEPGYRHDTFSSWHTLLHASPAYAELGAELAAHGLEYANAEGAVTATIRPGGEVVVGHRDPERTAAGFGDADRATYLGALERFGANVDLVGELLGTELHSRRALRLAWKLYRRLGHRQALAFAGSVNSSARDWLSAYEAPGPVDLLAPWSLHTGLTPDDAGGGFMLPMIAATLHMVGTPVVKGGAANFVRACEGLIAEHGGRVRTGAEVERILVRNGRAVGVVAGGEEIGARRAVIANVTPNQLYGRLLDSGSAPDDAIAQGRAYRFSRRAGTMIHLALSEPPRWAAAELREVPLVHLCDGIEAIGLASAQARAGLLPAAPTIGCGQQWVLDPARVPDGGAGLWVQLFDIPYAPVGDAAGEIDTGDGEWTAELEAALAERVVARLASHIPNLREAIVGQAVISPPELERRNPNLVGGDIYSGSTEPSQSLLWRPLPSYGSHATPVKDLYVCGASTYPGAGLNPGSGRMVAQRLLGRAFGRGRRGA